jgi:SAM-dependent methyltransferase
MPSIDTKQAEKEYLARTGSTTWERTKPFSHAGADTLADSAQLLHDFAAAMMILQPAPDDLILDLGAGGCWCSDLLGRLNRCSVAVDISLDMLRAGRSRPNGGSIRAVAGDLERLPFRSATFQKAICLSAIHHVPDIPAAVREISRVLTDDGIALFCEPGRGHARAAVSTAAMRDFGVLEQDILIHDFTATCLGAGFRDVRVKALSYTIPAFDLTPDQWNAWTRVATSKRPIRALRKMGRALVEFCGLGKRGVLFEETAGIALVRTLRHAMEDHPIIVATKAPGGEPGIGPHRAAEILVKLEGHVNRSDTITVDATVTNRGSAAWKAVSRSGTGHVSLGIQLVDAQGRLLVRDYCRVPLPHDVPPGAAIILAFSCPAPQTAGVYGLKFDLVAEGVAWFETSGSPTVTRELRVS